MTYDNERQQTAARIAELREAAAGMRYFGDWAEAEALEAEADELAGSLSWTGALSW